MLPKKLKPHKRRSTAQEKPSKREPISRELSAGGIVFSRSGANFLFAVMKDSYGKWAFPKGHVEPGEDIEEAAARETLEELGLSQIQLLDYLGKIDIWFRDKFNRKGVLVHKDIHYYLFEAPEGSDLRPDPQEHTYEAKWVSLSKVEKVSDYTDMVPIVKKAVELVKTYKKG